MLASKHGFIDTVTAILDGGAKVNIEDDKGRSALWWAASRGHQRVAKILLQKNASANSAVALFAEKGNSHALETLFSAEIPLNIVNDHGQTGLVIAARHGNLNVVKLYLSKGMDIHTLDNKGYTALHRASGYGHARVAQYLLDQGADPNRAGQRNLWTPVSLAARYGHLDILKMLHRKGGNLNVVTYKGWSPLMLAARGKYPSVVKYLLENKVDQAHQNNKRQTAADIAVKSQDQSIVELLSESTLID